MCNDPGSYCTEYKCTLLLLLSILQVLSTECSTTISQSHFWRKQLICFAVNGLQYKCFPHTLHNLTSAVYFRYEEIYCCNVYQPSKHHLPSAGCWKLTYAYPRLRRVIISLHTRMLSTGPAVENFSNSMASVTSGCRSPTYREDIG